MTYEVVGSALANRMRDSILHGTLIWHLVSLCTTNERQGWKGDAIPGLKGAWDKTDIIPYGKCCWCSSKGYPPSTHSSTSVSRYPSHCFESSPILPDPQVQHFLYYLWVSARHQVIPNKSTDRETRLLTTQHSVTAVSLVVADTVQRKLEQ